MPVGQVRNMCPIWYRCELCCPRKLDRFRGVTLKCDCNRLSQLVLVGVALAFVLVDCRHEPQKIDLEFMYYLGENGIPFSIIFTKADKLKEDVLEQNIEHYKKVLLESWEELPNYFITSSSNHIGKEALLNYIDSINKSLS